MAFVLLNIKKYVIYHEKYHHEKWYVESQTKLMGKTLLGRRKSPTLVLYCKAIVGNYSFKTSDKK